MYGIFYYTNNAYFSHGYQISTPLAQSYYSGHKLKMHVMTYFGS